MKPEVKSWGLVFPPYHLLPRWASLPWSPLRYWLQSWLHGICILLSQKKRSTTLVKSITQYYAISYIHRITSLPWFAQDFLGLVLKAPYSGKLLIPDKLSWPVVPHTQNIPYSNLTSSKRKSRRYCVPYTTLCDTMPPLPWGQPRSLSAVRLVTETCSQLCSGLLFSVAFESPQKQPLDQFSIFRKLCE